MDTPEELARRGVSVDLVTDMRGLLIMAETGAPVIFEQEMSLNPGPFQIVSVAHEHVTGLVASSEGGTDWPKPDPDHASMGPIALVQPVEAVFVRDGNVRGQGSLALGEDRAALTDRPGDRPHLVVCPTSVVGNWQREIAKFAPALEVHVHVGLAMMMFREPIRSAIEGSIDEYIA